MKNNISGPVFWSQSFLVCLFGMHLSVTHAAETNNTPIIQPLITQSHQGKIGARLRAMADQNRTTAQMAKSIAQPVRANIQLSAVPADLAQKLEALNIQVLQISERYHLATVQLTQDSNLDGLQKLSEVLYVSRDFGSRTNAGSATDHSVSSLNVDQVRQYLPDLTGKNVRIGIISDSFARSNGVRGDKTTPAAKKAGMLKNALNQISGDLPASVELRNDSDQYSSTDEGAAMAENIHDIAPQADISFYSDLGSQLGFIEAVKDLCKPRSEGGAGADIIVDDTIYFAEPFYQPGAISQAINECVDSGVMFFTIAGNDNERSYEFSYRDIDTSTYDNHPASGDKVAYGYDFHQWPNGTAFLPITIPAGSHFNAVLNWNQPYISYQSNKVNFPQIDFDMYLLQKNPQTNQMSLLYSSTDSQGSGIYNDPFEQIWYTNNSRSSQTLYLAVNHWSGNTDVIPQNLGVPVKLDLRFPMTSDNVTYGLTFNSSMLFGHAYAKNATTVAAMPWYGSLPYVNDESNIFVEYETSKGSANHMFYFDLNGQFMLDSRQKPEITGTDGGDTSFFGEDIPSAWNVTGEPNGYPNFFGTSSAAPTVAAVAALLKQYAGPDVPNDMIKQALISTARDIKTDRGSKGWDPVTGAGEVDAQAALDYLKKELGQE